MIGHNLIDRLLQKWFHWHPLRKEKKVPSPRLIDVVVNQQRILLAEGNTGLTRQSVDWNCRWIVPGFQLLISKSIQTYIVTVNVGIRQKTRRLSFCFLPQASRRCTIFLRHIFYLSFYGGRKEGSISILKLSNQVHIIKKFVYLDDIRSVDTVDLFISLLKVKTSSHLKIFISSRLDRLKIKSKLLVDEV